MTPQIDEDDEKRQERRPVIDRWDAWRSLSALTPARIGLGRAGAAQRTEVHLAFQAAHAAARDAVHRPWDVDAFEREVAELGLVVLRAKTQADGRQRYLRDPNLGRRLTADSEASLSAARGNGAASSGPTVHPTESTRPDGARPEGLPRPDVVLVVTNGLSADGIARHGAGLVTALVASLEAAGLTLGPLVLAPEARVAIGDPIGACLDARLVIVIVGERPGLSASDSVGIYLTYEPRPGRSDAERNCISNVHPPEGLDYAKAAAKTAWLARQALARGLTGVDLKDESPDALALVP